MRRCPRSEEIRQSLAAEEPLAPGLAAHVAACAECANAKAAARRYDARLSAAMTDLVTDALPPITVMAARMAPRATRRRLTPGTVVSTVIAGAFVVFAAVGVVTTGVSISDAMRSGAAADPEAPEQDLDRVDCYLGGSMVEVTVERIGGAGPEGTVAYCFGVEELDADRDAAMTCAESEAAAAAARRAREADRMARESAGASDSFTEDDGEVESVGACTLDEEADAADRPIDADPPPALPSTQLDSWDEAAATTAWPVVRPGWLPDGYQLAALQGFAALNDREAVDWISATYLRNGILLSFDQFEIADPDDPGVELSLPGFELGEVSAGQTTVGDHPAFWAAGVVAAPGGTAGSEVHALVLSWNEGGIGYQISARNEDLDTLERIAESLTDR